jgi:metal-responsive CopG/Arc/MetJ family transcriptional regulator
MSEMANVTISLSEENIKKLDALAKKENRKRSNQIVHMMEFYIENQKK